MRDSGAHILRPRSRAKALTVAMIAGAAVVFVGTARTAQESERFEVVSIKSRVEPIDFTDDQIHGVSYHAVGLTLLNLIEDAYTIGRLCAAYVGAGASDAPGDARGPVPA
jgi:hypothetical protein